MGSTWSKSPIASKRRAWSMASATDGRGVGGADSGPSACTRAPPVNVNSAANASACSVRQSFGISIANCGIACSQPPGAGSAHHVPAPRLSGPAVWKARAGDASDPTTANHARSRTARRNRAPGADPARSASIVLVAEGTGPQVVFAETRSPPTEPQQPTAASLRPAQDTDPIVHRGRKAFAPAGPRGEAQIRAAQAPARPPATLRR